MSTASPPAGRDTTAISLSFALYQLSLHPDVEARVLQEIQREVGDGPLTIANLSALEYTKRVIMETLRMFPPGDHTTSGSSCPHGSPLGRAQLLRSSACIRKWLS